MKKLIALELDITTIVEGFTPYLAGIWWRKMTVPQSVQDSSFMTAVFGASWGSFPVDPLEIGSLRVDNDLLGSVGSIEELREQDNAFYFDSSSQVLYIALFDYKPCWYYRSYKTGETTGFMDQTQLEQINGVNYPVDSRIGSVFYDARLEADSVSASEEIDDQVNGLFIFDDVSGALTNNDGVYDKIRDNITGNEMRVRIANLSDSAEEEQETGFPYKLKADSSDFVTERLGIVEDVSYSDPNAPQISAIDRRANWTQTIGGRLLTVSEFPNLESKNINKFAPLPIGPVKGVQAVQLEPNPGTSAATDFLVCETAYGDIQSVDGVYFDGRISGVDVDRYLTGGEYSINLTTGILTVNNFDRGKIWVDGTFTEYVETVEIILFLLNEFENLAYIASNFDKNEVEKIRSLNYRTHVYIDEGGAELSSTIEKLVQDIQVDFFQRGEVLTMRLANEERASLEDIPNSQVVDVVSGWVNDRSETVKTIAVTYDKNYRENTESTYYDDSKEQDAIDNNLKAVDKVFETNLLFESDVQEIYDAYYNRFTAPSRTVTINRTIPFTAGLTDFVTYKVARQAEGKEVTVFDRAIYKIISRDPVNNTADIIYFSDREEPFLSSEGWLAGPDLAYQAPVGVDAAAGYQGALAYQDLAFSDMASITGTILSPLTVIDGGIMASIPQQVGE